jgi:putative ATP-binding cassette transporter
VQDSLAWFVDNYSTLARWRATTDRLTSFDDSFKALPLNAIDVSATNSGISPSADFWRVTGLALHLPNGRELNVPGDVSIRAGDTVLVQGPSGSGKSTLFRALAGIWPWSQGQVRHPADHPESTLFLPQRPYFPHGTLRDALAYPEAATRYTDDELKAALHNALLPQLTEQLDDEDAWGSKLSGGEQQRLAIARVLLKQPRWLFVDEGTSALDAQAEQLIYQRLQAMVLAKEGALVSIAHRPQVAAFHSTTIQVKAVG